MLDTVTWLARQIAHLKQRILLAQFVLHFADINSVDGNALFYRLSGCNPGCPADDQAASLTANHAGNFGARILGRSDNGVERLVTDQYVERYIPGLFQEPVRFRSSVDFAHQTHYIGESLAVFEIIGAQHGLGDKRP